MPLWNASTGSVLLDVHEVNRLAHLLGFRGRGVRKFDATKLLVYIETLADTVEVQSTHIDGLYDTIRTQRLDREDAYAKLEALDQLGEILRTLIQE